MAYEDDWLKDQIKIIGTFGPDKTYGGVIGVLSLLLSKINKLEQDVKELKNGGKKHGRC